MSHTYRYQIKFTESDHIYIGHVSPDGFIEYGNAQYQSLTSFCVGALGSKKKDITDEILANSIVFRDSYNLNSPSTAYNDIKEEIGNAKGTCRILVIHRILNDIYGGSYTDGNDIDSILQPLTDYIHDHSYNLSEDKKKYIVKKLIQISNTLLDE